MAMVGTVSLPTLPVNHPLTPAPDAAALEPRLPRVSSLALREEGCIGTAAQPGASALTQALPGSHPGRHCESIVTAAAACCCQTCGT